MRLWGLFKFEPDEVRFGHVLTSAGAQTTLTDPALPAASRSRSLTREFIHQVASYPLFPYFLIPYWCEANKSNSLFQHVSNRVRE